MPETIDHEYTNRVRELAYPNRIKDIARLSILRGIRDDLQDIVWVYRKQTNTSVNPTLDTLVDWLRDNIATAQSAVDTCHHSSGWHMGQCCTKCGEAG